MASGSAVRNWADGSKLRGRKPSGCLVPYHIQVRFRITDIEWILFWLVNLSDNLPASQQITTVMQQPRRLFAEVLVLAARNNPLGLASLQVYANAPVIIGGKRKSLHVRPESSIPVSWHPINS